MKRSRDDVFLGSQAKRPAISPCVEQAAQVQMSTASSAQRLTTTDALSYLKTVKEIFKDRRDKYEDFLDVMKDFKAQRIDTSGVILRVKELFKGSRDLILGFNAFLPKGYEITLPLEKKHIEFDEAISFVNKIKIRFQGDDHVYKTFLDILNMYRKGNKCIREVYQEVSVLFQDHPDLLVEFTHFLPDTSGSASVNYPQSVRNHIIHGDDRGSPMTKARSTHVEKKPVCDGYINPCDSQQWNHVEKEKEKGEDREKNEWEQDDNSGHKRKSPCCSDPAAEQFHRGSLRSNKQVLRSLKVDGDGDNHDREDGERNKDYDYRERDRHGRVLASNAKDILGQKMLDKLMTKPIQELDLSNCDSCTPSYRLLPEHYLIPSASSRTGIGAKVLNDRWVSVTSGSEDYSFKHMRKNHYEESLFRCEDDRFELDVLLESVNATAKRVEELIDNMNANKTESSFRIEDHLTALDLRCIERLYGDHGIDVIDILRKNAPLGLPVILTRLKQKQDEWARCRADFNKVWAEIYAKNYHKSLDHRSFCFKQQDTKNMSAKALLAEIKEMSERNQNEDETVLSIGAGLKQCIKPHIEFEYHDLDIQEDLRQLIKYSCTEVCTPEECDKVMKLWTTFLEPFLSVPSCPPSTEDNSYAVEANNDIKQKPKNVGEENCRADEAYCKPLDMSKNGVEHIPREDNFGSKSDISCNVSPGAVGERNIYGENASTSVKLKGTHKANSDFVTELIPNQETQDGAITRLTASSSCTVPQEVKAQKHCKETDACSKPEREEGELSPNRNLEGNDFSASGNTESKLMEIPCKSYPNTREIGGEQMCIEEAGKQTDAIIDDEAEGSAHGSSESEHASENGDVSVSESANGEECSPKEPGEDGDHDKKGDSEGTFPFLDHFLQTVKPLKMKVPEELPVKEKNSRVFYGNDSLYLLFRLQQMLYERMQIAKLHSTSPQNKWRISNDANPTDSYARFKDVLHSLLNGSSDNTKFEDECQSIIGAQSYILFTLDKLIYKLVKKLQLVAIEEVDTKLLQLCSYERSRSRGTFSDAVYHQNARFLLPEDNLYRIEFFPSPMRLTIQLMKNNHDKLDPLAVSMDPYFAAYLNDELLSVVPERMAKPGVFLNRNKKIFLTGGEASDISKEVDGLLMHNGVEMKVNCNSLKVSYVLDTEDFLYRTRKRRRVLYGVGSSSGDSNGCPCRAKRCKLI